MVADPAVFRDLAFVFAAAVVGGALAWWMRQPLILGYVLGGILVGPFTPGPSISDTTTFALFADIGVALLMFSIGIEFSIRDLIRVRRVALVGAPLAVVLCIVLGLVVGVGLGWTPVQGMAVGAIVSVSSTMVAVRLLQDRGQLHSHHGRVIMGTSLVEDLAVVVLIVLMPALGALEPGRFLAIAIALGKAVLILAPFAVLVARIIPPLMTRIARMQSQELFLLVALAIGLGTAALTQAVGLSLALGAFLAGLIISESDYAHETLTRLLPIRDAFGALFFVTLGVLIDPSTLLANVPLLALMVGLVVLGKVIVRTPILLLLGERVSTALLVGVSLAQIGEFSFVLVQVARSAGHVGAEVYNATLAASLFSILLNGALVRSVPAAMARLRAAASEPPSGRLEATEWLAGHVVLCGFGRVGSAIGEALETFGLRFIVIERDPDIVRGLRDRRVPCLFGDAAGRRHLERASAERAALVVVALPDYEHARRVVRQVRALNPAVPVLARSHHAAGSEDLVRAGATEIINPEMEAAATLIRHSLRRLAQPQEQVIAYLERFREALEGADRGHEPASGTLPRMVEVMLGPGLLADQSLREARIRERLGVTVVAVTHPNGDVVMNPAAEAILRPGDLVRVFGLPGQIAAFQREAAGGG